MNTCRTCSTFSEEGGECRALDYYPNATIAEYGIISEHHDDAERVRMIKAEVHLRGPVAATVHADPLVGFLGGEVFDDGDEGRSAGRSADHVTSIVGWGVDDDDKEYWLVRNSWGAYWGEGGFFRVATGSNMLGIEAGISWATPGHFTVQNIPCSEDGTMGGGPVNGIDG